MDEYIHEAKEELKRADHLIYVSLKYTRTVDVIKSVIERLIATFDRVIEGLLVKAEEENKIIEVPPAPMLRVNILMKEIYPDNEELHDYLQFYLLLRKFSKAEYTRAREFRRHVTMTAMVDGEYHEIKIDHVTDYYKKTIDFIDFVKERL